MRRKIVGAIIRKATVLIGYLFFIALCFGFDGGILIDIREILLITAATILLAVAADSTSSFQEKIAKQALISAAVTTVTILLLKSTNFSDPKLVIQEIILCFRPLLYGILIWIIAKPETKLPAKPLSLSAVSAEQKDRTFRSLGLSKRESQIAQLALQQLSNKEIADRLFIAPTTVKKHMTTIFDKLKISKREELEKIFIDK